MLVKECSNEVNAVLIWNPGQRGQSLHIITVADDDEMNVYI